MAPTIDLLPNSIARRNPKVVVWPNGQKWLQPFCANCGKDSRQLVMQTEYELINNWAFYLCDPCAEKWSPLVDMFISPDEAFWRRVHDAQMEAFGRDLTPEEIVEALKDDNHILTKLCKDRHDLKLIT